MQVEITDVTFPVLTVTNEMYASDLHHKLPSLFYIGVETKESQYHFLGGTPWHSGIPLV
jgi:hypothetical protein